MFYKISFFFSMTDDASFTQYFIVERVVKQWTRQDLHCILHSQREYLAGRMLNKKSVLFVISEKIWKMFYKTAEQRKTEIRKVDKKFNLKLLVVQVFGNGKFVSRIAFALTKIDTICQLLTVRRHIQII